MIRINLLPTRDAPRRQAAVVQIVVLGVILLFAVVALVSVDVMKQREIDAQQRTNNIIKSRISRIRQQIQDHDQIRERIEEIESKQSVINRLQSGRTGPVMVMVELAKVLSRNGSPTIDHDRYIELVRRSSNQAYDPNWDGRRLWLQQFREESREVELEGLALSHEDVAELLQPALPVRLLHQRRAGRDPRREPKELFLNLLRARAREFPDPVPAPL